MKTIKLIPFFFSIFIVLQSCNEEPPTNLGKNYFLTYDGSWGHAAIINENNTIIIDADIVAWNFDSIFIIAKQKPFDEIFDSIRMRHPNTALDYREKLYDEIQIYNYWIIDKRKELESYYDEKTGRRRYTNAVSGPLTYEEFWKRRRELNVPDSLKLKESEKVSFTTPVHYWIYKWKNKPREKIVD